jgi:hypothetical protein
MLVIGRLARIRRFGYSPTSEHSAVSQFVEALVYKPEGRGFFSLWFHWDFSLTYIFWLHYGPGVDSASEYQGYILGGKGGRDLGLPTIPNSCADYLEILGASTSCSPKGLSRPVMR